MKSRLSLRGTVLIISGILFLVVIGAGSAGASLTFNFTYSGESFSNSATASGFITVNEALIPNPGVTDVFLPDAAILGLSITVSGASSGDGTFGLNDFDEIVFDTGGLALDFTKELMGQPTSGSPWGTPDGKGGDFNLFGIAPPTPLGVSEFTLQTDFPAGDKMLLTSMAPVPVPPTMILLGSGLLGLAGLRRKFRK